MRGMCPDRFIVAVKGAVLWGRGAARLWSDGGGGGGGGTVGGDTARRGAEMGEWEVDSCAGVNRRSLCVLPTKICDQLSVSVSQGGILEHFGWVYGGEDA